MRITYAMRMQSREAEDAGTNGLRWRCGVCSVPGNGAPARDRRRAAWHRRPTFPGAVEPFLVVQVLETRDELVTEDSTQYRNGQQKQRMASGAPSLIVGRQSAYARQCKTSQGNVHPNTLENPSVKKLASPTDPLWYKDAIIYELHVRAFADSNGDGIGDFPGLLARLDYLQNLGVTCIWLLPFFPSPLRDDGYDISNYVDVHPSYGTLNNFKSFLDAAHQRNMQVLIELVINHTSDQHPWFKAARIAPSGSPAREMYVWSQTDHLYKDVRIIFTDTE